MEGNVVLAVKVIFFMFIVIDYKQMVNMCNFFVKEMIDEV